MVYNGLGLEAPTFAAKQKSQNELTY